MDASGNGTLLEEYKEQEGLPLINKLDGLILGSP